MDQRIKKVINNLNNRNINSTYFNNRHQLKEILLKETININDKVGIGGSMTIKELDLYKSLTKRGNTVYWHWMTDSKYQNEERRKASFNSDIYLTSSNAITENGEIINIDGVGNRVAAMFFGPKRVVVICGTNKICPDYNSAINRIKNESCPLNARRLGLNTPCSVSGKCMDCRSNERMCNITTVINNKPMDIDFSVYLVGETLGF
ncbi:lactate utilization protein [Serpentinicella sp. ANB-PHB4]|uniref:lactate utilization protein n=1 Tax=Serpentinicella sp. ANB-PHB4 TaxID=3074076 RepID=UPI00285EA046|nr:lactate utilization protein [Serpentinicella sp. ANB-PHB4]MDR5660050.1 lactate utilization protein [Serpentinicella sp. ANB-PHB4]